MGYLDYNYKFHTSEFGVPMKAMQFMLSYWCKTRMTYLFCPWIHSLALVEVDEDGFGE